MLKDEGDGKAEISPGLLRGKAGRERRSCARSFLEKCVIRHTACQSRVHYIGARMRSLNSYTRLQQGETAQ
eukprot:3014041-Pleurochrysis_carterae.AAC.1